MRNIISNQQKKSQVDPTPRSFPFWISALWFSCYYWLWLLWLLSVTCWFFLTGDSLWKPAKAGIIISENIRKEKISSIQGHHLLWAEWIVWEGLRISGSSLKYWIWRKVAEILRRESFLCAFWPTGSEVSQWQKAVGFIGNWYETKIGTLRVVTGWSEFGAFS